MNTQTLAIQVAIRVARGDGWTSAIHDVAKLNRVSRGRVKWSCRYVANATCDPYLERLGAQFLP